MKDHHALIERNPDDPDSWQEMTLLHDGKAYRFVADPVLWEKHHATLSQTLRWPDRFEAAPAFAYASGEEFGYIDVADGYRKKAVGRYLGIVPEPGAQ